jgi:hypothetical protein
MTLHRAGMPERNGSMEPSGKEPFMSACRPNSNDVLQIRYCLELVQGLCHSLLGCWKVSFNPVKIICKDYNS